MKKFFDYIQLPNFDVAADATATFKVSASVIICTDQKLYSSSCSEILLNWFQSSCQPQMFGVSLYLSYAFA